MRVALAAAVAHQPALPCVAALATLPARCAAVGLGATAHLAYHALLRRAEAGGTPTWRSTMAKNRATWARHVLDTQGWLYATQTLRNAITANTFLASTMVSLFSLVVGFLWQSLQPRFDWRTLLQFGSVAVLLLRSAYEFLQSARLMTHAGFMFPVAVSVDVAPRRDDLVRDDLERVMLQSELTQWAGLRFLYLSSNAAVWIIGGEWAFLLSCVVMLKFLAGIDRPPQLNSKLSAEWT